jgi:hypothetical protein
VLATAQYVCDEMQSGGNPTELHSRLDAVWPSIAEKRHDVVPLHIHSGLLPANRRAGLTRTT